jgi:DNA-binding NarL/FixJ family response regulator
MRILIIEDNAEFRESLCTLLCSRNHAIEVFEALDGNEAMILARACHPDLVFIDIQLPDKTGLTVTREIKRHYPETPVAILTTYDLPEYRMAANRCGADYFFGKDTSSVDELLGLVDCYLPH